MGRRRPLQNPNFGPAAALGAASASTSSTVPYPAPPPALVPHPAPPPLSHSTLEDWEKYGLREGLARGCAERRGGRRRRRHPPPCAAAPCPLQRGVREKMREIRYERTPRTAAASPSPPPSSTVRCCRHSPFCSSSQIRQRESGPLLLTDPEEGESERAGTR